jgi:hypothetical protein
VFSRRSFMALASGLLLPYEPERVYSFVRRTRVERLVWADLIPPFGCGEWPLTAQVGLDRATIIHGKPYSLIHGHGVYCDRAQVGDVVRIDDLAIGRVTEITYGWHFANGDYELRNHA